MKIRADFTNVTGKIRPVHSVGQPPRGGRHYEAMHFLSDANIPYSRLHDVGGEFAANRFVDIPNIFRDFDKDENLPESYDFAFTDNLLEAMHKNGIKPFFRLGVTIENHRHVKPIRIFPPKDYEKWARICEHIIRHYNEGWANGYHYGIEYWEIWNEPENNMGEMNECWTGTAEEYYRLYDVTAKHLKACFGDTIKIGGYASTGIPTAEVELYEKEPDHKATTRREYFIEFARGFLSYIKEHNSPIDYFSWHSYAGLEVMLDEAKTCRHLLASFGFEDLPDIIDEWNICHTVENRPTAMAMVHTLSALLAFQKMPLIAMTNFYDARIDSSSLYQGFFSPETKLPFLTYYSFVAFGKLYALENEVFTESDNEKVYVGAATNGTKSTLIVTNTDNAAIDVDLDICGADLSTAEIIVGDAVFQYRTIHKDISNGKLTLGANSFVQINFN